MVTQRDNRNLMEEGLPPRVAMNSGSRVRY